MDQKENDMRWNVYSLKEYFDLAISNLDEKMEIAKAELNRRLEGMNEIRQQLGDQASTFVTKGDLKLVEHEVKNLSKMVWVGLGIWMFLQLTIAVIILLLFRK